MPSSGTNSRSSLGELTVICGCMFAGKTGRLIERLAAASAAGRRVLAFKHPLDRRYNDHELATHDGRRFPAAPVGGLPELLERSASAQVVGIDEVQFFGRGLVPIVEQMLARGQHVIAAGLNHDTWGQPFPPLPELQTLAAEVDHLHARCTACGGPAEFHQRMVPVVGGNLVGGPSEYEPRCTAHFTPLPPPAPAY